MGSAPETGGWDTVADTANGSGTEAQDPAEGLLSGTSAWSWELLRFVGQSSLCPQVAGALAPGPCRLGMRMIHSYSHSNICDATSMNVSADFWRPAVEDGTMIGTATAHREGAMP